MVKTRHSGDIDVESPPKFLSLANEKSRQSLKSGDATGDGSGTGRQSTGAYGDSRDAYSIFEEKVVESRLRPRIGPSRAYNYLDVDSSDEEIIRGRRVRRHSLDEFSSERRRSGYSRSRQIKQELLDEQQGRSRRMLRGRRSSREELEMSMEDEDFEEPNNHRRKRRNHSEVLDESEDRGEDKQMRGRMTRRRQHSIEDDQEDSEISQRRNPRRRQQGSREEDKERVDSHTTRAQGSSRRQLDTTEEDEEQLIRRSSRTRRQVYDTLNQSFLVNIPGRSKHDSDDNQDHSDGKDQDTDDNKEFSDMYSRVKRKRVQVKRNMYGVPVNDDSDSDQDIAKRNKNNNKQDDEEDDDEENEEDEEEENDKDNRRITRQNRMPLRKKQPEIVKSYSLREHKPRTDLYKAPVEERRIKRIHHSIFAVTPTKKNTSQTYHSPAQRRNIRKRSALHSSSSSTSSSESESNDEKSFRRRKAKSMAKARSRMMPMNFAGNDIPSASVLKDRIKSGASLADVEPMNIDRSVTFNSIGGLGKHIRALKEMVVFPLLYDKVFQRFKVDPPRGVLFYGPPGTGKTLVARALANECSQGDRRVAFFMRKGADCLSKWVGESERQLRLLFDQAYKFRPSIIFFDEIDGLAPVRSSRQDQIHSSIVSTLLALMDGLDSRGEIVVIGATNRIDSLDPALRRPGRFDREFFFPLPSLEARKQILKIHTTCWTPKLNDQFTSELAEKCVGYCGADLKALCTEAAMLALRRRYPQIYITNEALQLDVSSINVSAKDFFDAIGNIIPTSQRAVNTPARALTARVYPLLHRQLDKVLNQLSDMFPLCLAQTASLDAAVTTSQAEALAESGFIWEELASDEDEDAPSIFVPSTSSKGSRSNRRSTDDGPSTSSQTVPTYLNFTSYATSRPATFRPRLMLVGKEGQGQTTYIAPAVVHKMENLPVHVLDLPALYAVTAKTPEESCANVFHEAKRKCPSIVYLPYINQWWDVMAETLRATLLTLIQDLDPTIPLLLLATSEQPYHTLDPQLQCLFSQISGEVIQMTDPNMEERRTFYKDLLLRQACRPPPQKKQAAQRMLEVLPKAAAPKPRELTKEELKALVEKEELTLMELRIFLRDVLNKLGSDKKFSIFAKPVNIEDAPDYYEIIEQPMDLSTMMGKIDLHEYNTVRAFMHDIDLICSNALEYNPNRGPMDRVIRHRACALKDTAYAIIKTELDKDFEKTCVEIEESRKRRGEKSTTIPDFYYTRPKNQQQTSRQSQPVIPSYLQISKPVRSIPKPEGERFSRRVRGLTTDPVPSLETVEKVYRTSKSCSSPTRDKNNSNEDSSTPGPSEPTKSASQSDKNDHSLSVKKDSTPVQKEEKKSDESKSGEANKSSSASSKKRKNKCVWCRPRRKRPKILAFRQASRASGDEQQGSGDEQGEEEMSAEEEEDEQSQDSQGPETSEQLVVDTSEHDESAELKSPSRISTRKSPATSNPGSRVSTRRNSMSPHSASHSHTSPSTQTQGNTDHTEPSKEVEETTTVTQSTSPAEKEKKTGKPETDTGTHDVEDLTEPIRQNSSPPSEPLDKSRVVKRLDLDSVAVDSGVGSSVDSNGDSRDSMDHRGEGDSSIAAASVFTPAHTPAQDSNQNCTTTTELQNKASAILNEPNQKIVVDNNRLSSLLNRLVARTDGYNVERLEKIYSHLSQIIYRHRHEYNRAGMIVNLERKVDELTKIHPPGSSTTPY